MIKKVSRIIYCVFLVTTISLLIGILFQDYYQRIPISKYWECLKQTSPRENNLIIYSIYFTVAMGVFTAYFTLLSIILSRKNVSFWDYLIYTKSFGLLLMICINVGLTVSLIFYNRLTFLEEIYLSISIILILSDFIISLLKLTYVENIKKGAELLQEQLAKAKKSGNLTIAISFINAFFEVCYPKKTFDMLDTLYKEWPQRTKNHKEIESFFISLYEALCNQNKNEYTYKASIEFLLKRSYESITEGGKPELNTLQNTYKLIFKLYKQLLWQNKYKDSYIIKIKEPIYFYILHNRDNITKEISDFYSYLLNECKQIIYISLYHCDFGTIQEEIHEYMGMSQFLDLYPNLKSLIVDYERHIVDILVRIINVVLIGKNTKKLLNFTEPLLNSISTIEIFDVDYEMYDELLPPVDLYEVYYTRTYFICVFLIFYGIKTSEDDLIETIKKLKYNNDSTYSKGYEYDYLLAEIRKIKNKPNNIDQIYPSKNKKFIETVQFLENHIQSLFDQEKQDSFNKLKAADISNILPDAINSECESLQKQMKEICLNEKRINLKDFYKLKSNFIFSKRILCNDRHISTFDINYLSYFEGLLLNRYIQLSSIKYITNIQDIDNITTEKEIYISERSRFDIYSLKGISIDNDELTYENGKLKINWCNMNKGFIIPGSIFKQNLCMPEIQIDDKNPIYKEETNDIQIHIDYELSFKISSIELFTYCLIN